MIDDRGFLMIVVAGGPAPSRGPHRVPRGRGWAARSMMTPLEALALLDQGVRPDGLIVGLSGMGGHEESVLRRVREAHPETPAAICAWPVDAEGLERLGTMTPHGPPLLILAQPLDEEAIRDVCRQWSGPGSPNGA